jgi:hypothetical protein
MRAVVAGMFQYWVDTEPLIHEQPGFAPGFFMALSEVCDPTTSGICSLSPRASCVTEVGAPHPEVQETNVSGGA